MTEKTAKAAVTLIAGASKKTNLSAPAGIMSSLRRSLMPSHGLEQAPRPHPHGPSLACMKEDFALHVDEVSHNPASTANTIRILMTAKMSGWTSKSQLRFGP